MGSERWDRNGGKKEYEPGISLCPFLALFIFALLLLLLLSCFSRVQLCATPQNSSILNWMNCYSYLLGLRNQLETSWQTTGANHVIWEKLNKMQKQSPRGFSNTMIIKDNCIPLIDFNKSVVYVFLNPTLLTVWKVLIYPRKNLFC